MENKKPAFVWKGTEGLKRVASSETSVSTQDQEQEPAKRREGRRSSRKDQCFENTELSKIVVAYPYTLRKEKRWRDEEDIQTTCDRTCDRGEGLKLTSRSAFRICRLYDTSSTLDRNEESELKVRGMSSSKKKKTVIIPSEEADVMVGKRKDMLLFSLEGTYFPVESVDRLADCDIENLALRHH